MIPFTLDAPLIHPDYRVWVRHSARSEWVEQPVYTAAVDMWHPRLIGHATIPTDEKILVKVVSNLVSGEAEVRPAGAAAAQKNSDGSLRLELKPNTTTTLQWSRDPGLCLHLRTCPEKLNRAPSRPKDIVRFQAGLHVIPGGVLKLQSNQTLQLDQGAILKAGVVCENVENVVIRGLGMIDLLANCPTDPPSEQAAKEQAIRILNSQNIRVEGITIRNPSHYGILLGQSKNVRISHVSIFTHCRWGDGIDSMACSDLIVEHSFVRASDDCLAIYADRGECKGHVSGHRYRYCTLWADVAHPVMVGVHGKHKPPGRIIEDLQFQHLTILRHCEASPMYQGCLTLNPGDLNTIQNVLFSDIRIEDPEAPRLLDLRILFNPAYNPVPGKAIHDIIFRRIYYTGNPKISSVVEGYDRHRRVWNIQIEDLRINNTRQKRLQNLQINQWAESPAIK